MKRKEWNMSALVLFSERIGSLYFPFYSLFSSFLIHCCGNPFFFFFKLKQKIKAQNMKIISLFMLIIKVRILIRYEGCNIGMRPKKSKFFYI